MNIAVGKLHGETKAIALDHHAAQRLRQLRWSYSITWEDCAEQLRISVVDFMKKERGRDPFTATEFALLAKLFKSTPAKLLSDLSST